MMPVQVALYLQNPTYGNSLYRENTQRVQSVALQIASARLHEALGQEAFYDIRNLAALEDQVVSELQLGLCMCCRLGMRASFRRDRLQAGWIGRARGCLYWEFT